MSSLPSNWTQQSSDALRWVVEQALDMAKQNPGEWINPTPLESKVQYNPSYDEYEIYGRYSETSWFGELAPCDRSMAETVLMSTWDTDLRTGDHDRNYRYVEELNLRYDMGFRRRRSF